MCTVMYCRSVLTLHINITVASGLKCNRATALTVTSHFVALSSLSLPYNPQPTNLTFTFTLSLTWLRAPSLSSSWQHASLVSGIVLQFPSCQFSVLALTDSPLADDIAQLDPFTKRCELVLVSKLEEIQLQRKRWRQKKSFEKFFMEELQYTEKCVKNLINISKTIFPKLIHFAVELSMVLKCKLFFIHWVFQRFCHKLQY